jgi:hypothetical protein
MSCRFSLYEKLVGLRSLAQEQMKPLSKAVWHTGPSCRFLEGLDRDHVVNNFHLQSAVEAADTAIRGSVESQTDEIRRSKSLGQMEKPEPIGTGSSRYSMGQINPLSSQCHGKTDIYQAAITNLSKVLEDEISWLDSARCSAADLISHASHDHMQDKDVEQLRNLAHHCKQTIERCAHLIHSR